MYVLTNKHGIQKLSSDLKQYVSRIDISNQLYTCLMGICIDTYDNIYVTDMGDDNKKSVIMLTTEGEFIANFGDQRCKVHGIAVNKMGDLFVCCYRTGELVVYRA